MTATAASVRRNRTNSRKAMMVDRSAGVSIELPDVLAVTPDGLRALELVDDAHPRPIPWHEVMRSRN